MENDLEKQIAQLGGKLLRIARFHCVEDFVGLLDEELAERFVGLLAVPGAAGGGAQASLEGDELFEPAAGEPIALADSDLRSRGRARVRALPFAPL